MQIKIPCVIMRGGTSKALFFKERNLPQDQKVRERVIMQAFGSPDPYGRQINGLGGATSTTSKVAVIEPREGEPNTVNYTFGQVDITSPMIDYKGNCGNISSAVGPFAVDEGMVKITEPVTEVYIYNTNTRKYIKSYVPVKDGKAKVEGNFSIDGVPGTGAKLAMEFRNPGGSVTGELLPTGNSSDVLKTEYGGFEVSIVDAANPLIFVRAEDLGLSGVELPPRVDGDAELLKKIESIRAAAAVNIGIVNSVEEASTKSRAVPKIAFIAGARDYKTSKGTEVKAEQIDLVARIMSMGKLHAAYALTGAICTSLASKVKNSLVWKMIPSERREMAEVLIGHPGGIIPAEVDIDGNDATKGDVRVRAFRTARRLMEGQVLVPGSIVKGELFNY